MPDDRKQPGVAFWATVALVVVLVGYPLSFGPACWWFGKPSEQVVLVSRAYAPIGWIAVHAWTPIGLVFRWYARVGLPPKVRVAVPTSQKENGGILLL
jgi:hypothetical protein